MHPLHILAQPILNDRQNKKEYIAFCFSNKYLLRLNSCD